jgi:dTDP-glucose 4,6-dehydratase
VRALITGGAGFLGSHMCDRLLKEGHDVVCVDNLKTSRMETIAHLSSNPSFHFIQHDITEPLFLDRPLDVVMHFASPASPKDYAKLPIQTLKVGGLGTYHALGLAKASRATFLLASTSEVYGDPEVNPQPESYWGHVNPVGPRSVYDEAKRYAEAMSMAYRHTHGIRIRIARIFNTYGPRMRIDDGRALPNFITQALRGEPITIYGDGLQTRSFCYVSDLIEGVYRLIRLPGHESIIVNLGSPEEITLKGLAAEILETTGSKSNIVFCPLPEDDPRVRRPDIQRAKEILGWAPAVPRRKGLEETVEYFRNALADGGNEPLER